jgi:hypothetical protein
MPVATAEQYAAMLDAAAGGGYALAAVNVTSSETLNGALRGFAEAGADGIVQVTTGGAAFLSGDAVGDVASGAHALAEFARTSPHGPRVDGDPDDREPGALEDVDDPSAYERLVLAHDNADRHVANAGRSRDRRRAGRLRFPAGGLRFPGCRRALCRSGVRRDDHLERGVARRGGRVGHEQLDLPAGLVLEAGELLAVALRAEGDLRDGAGMGGAAAVHGGLLGFGRPRFLGPASRRGLIGPRAPRGGIDATSGMDRAARSLDLGGRGGLRSSAIRPRCPTA